MNKSSFPSHVKTELSMKNEKIESLRISNEAVQKELSQTKIKLSVAKSYINSLPTLEEVGRLKVLFLKSSVV